MVETIDEVEKINICLIDDSLLNLSFLKHALRKLIPHTNITVYHDPEVVDFEMMKHCGLIIIDEVMGHWRGTDLIKELIFQSDYMERAALPPIIFISSMMEYELEAKIMAKGLHRVLPTYRAVQKPVPIENLYSIVNGLCPSVDSRMTSSIETPTVADSLRCAFQSLTGQECFDIYRGEAI